MEVGNNAVLRFCFEIDQQVAATEQIELGERRVLDDVLHGEHHRVADVFLHLVAGVVLGKEAAQAFRRDVLGDVGRIVTGPRHGDGVVVEVGGVDLNVQFPLLPGADLILQLEQEDGDRVGFLAAGATGHPDAEHVVLRLVCQQRWQDGLLERDKGLGVAEKAGDIDQQFPKQQWRLVGVFPQKARIGRFVLDVVQRHAAFDATTNRALLVEREVMPGAGTQLQQNFADAALLLLRPDGFRVRP